ERLLGDVDGTRLVLLVRGRAGADGRARAAELLSRPVFNSVRERIGADGLKALFDERVEVLEGDVTGDLPALSGDLDIAIHAAARRPEMLDRFVARARAAHGRAGPQEVAHDAERRGRDWVTKRLVHYGRARAQTLGWPDAYTFTKALGERAVEEIAGELPLSI